MANQAWKDAVNPGYKPTTRQSVIDQINQSIQDYQNALANRSSAGSTRNWDTANTFSTQMIGANEKQTQLKYLLNAMGNNGVGMGEAGGGAGGAGGGGNPFNVGGGAAGGAPTLDTSNPYGAAPTLNTSNRFESGLGDAEGRLRGLLDNPDSVQQSAAYKFRVNQGQEALQRSLGAKGMLNSGNRLMELTKYGQDMGSQEYDNQYGRLSNLLGNYSQSWLGDKNANTSLYNAQAGAWNTANANNTGRFSAQANAWNTAQANADRIRLGYADIAAQNSRAASTSSGGGGRSSGGGGSTRGLYDVQSWNPDTDPTLQRMKRDSSWNYDYSQGGQSLWRNTHTGENAWSPGGREGNPTGGEYYNTPAWKRNGG